MKIKLYLLLLISAAIILPAQADGANAVIKKFRGDVFVVRGDTLMISAKDTDVINEKDSVFVSDTGMAIIYVPTFRMTIYADTRSKIQFWQLPASPKKRSFFYMKFGNFYFKIGKVLYANMQLRTFHADIIPRTYSFHIYSDMQGTVFSNFMGSAIFSRKNDENICNVTRDKFARLYRGKLIYPRKMSTKQKYQWRDAFLARFDKVFPEKPKPAAKQKKKR